MPTISTTWVILSTLAVVAGFVVVDRATMPLASYIQKHGISGVDIHKLHKPRIPEMGGISMIIGLILCSASLLFLRPDFAAEFLAFMLVTVVATGIGVLDAFKPFGPLSKIFFLAVASLPLLILGTYYPYPAMPFIGSLRLTILYPVLFVPVFVTLVSNATNMMDVLNGSMTGTSTVSAVFLFLVAVLFNRWEVALMYVMLAACILAFYRYNRYPARVFPGDAGTLGVGAAFAAVGVIGRMEVVTLIALLPTMVNGSLILSTVGRLFEHRDIKERPTVLTEDGRIAASLSRVAPITLTRLFTASSPLREDEVVRCFLLLHVLTGVLAVATAFFMVT